MEARAMYDFRAQQEDELSFQRNDILKILQTDEVKYFLLMFNDYVKRFERKYLEEISRMRIGIGRN